MDTSDVEGAEDTEETAEASICADSVHREDMPSMRGELQQGSHADFSDTHRPEDEAIDSRAHHPLVEEQSGAEYYRNDHVCTPANRDEQPALDPPAVDTPSQADSATFEAAVSGDLVKTDEEETLQSARDIARENVLSEAQVSDAAPTDNRTSDLRKALVGFYNLHNPSRIATLDAILDKYVGKEDILIDRLEEKYSTNLSHIKRAALSRHASGKTLPPHETSESRALDAAPLGSVSEGETVPKLVSTTSGAAHRGQGDIAGTQHSDERVPSIGSHVGNTSSSYMRYLADQIKSNVEVLLPTSASSAGSASVRAHSAAHATKNVMPREANIPVELGSDQGARLLMPPLDRRGASVGPGSWSSMSSHVGGAPSAGIGPDNADRAVHRGQTGVGTEAVSQRAISEAAVRLKALEEDRLGLMATCRRWQGKAEAASREAAAVEELREAGQRKLAGFAERVAAAERHARETGVRLRALEVKNAKLQADKEATDRRCQNKHSQLLSAIDTQMALRSQIEALLDYVPPFSKRENAQNDGEAREASVSYPTSDEGESRNQEDIDTNGTSPTDRRGTDKAGRHLNSNVPSGAGNGDDYGVNSRRDGGGDESGGGILDEAERRCALLELRLKASLVEASEAKRARDAAENVSREQRNSIEDLRRKIESLETILKNERETGQTATRAVRGLEDELDSRLSALRDTEAKLADSMAANDQLRGSLRRAGARLETASAARVALLDFCRQEKTIVEQQAAEHIAQAEENASMRGEEGLARGLELARIAQEAGGKAAAVAAMEMDRLTKALFTLRAKLANSEEIRRALKMELDRAAEMIANLRAKPVTGGDAQTRPVGEDEIAGSGSESPKTRKPRGELAARLSEEMECSARDEDQHETDRVSGNKSGETQEAYMTTAREVDSDVEL